MQNEEQVPRLRRYFCAGTAISFISRRVEVKSLLDIRKPGKLHRNAGIALQAWLVHRSFPPFVLQPALHFKILVNLLDPGDHKTILGRTSVNKIFRRFGIAIFNLHLLLRRKMVREP